MACGDRRKAEKGRHCTVAGTAGTDQYRTPSFGWCDYGVLDSIRNSRRAPPFDILVQQKIVLSRSLIYKMRVFYMSVWILFHLCRQRELLSSPPPKQQILSEADQVVHDIAKYHDEGTPQLLPTEGLPTPIVCDTAAVDANQQQQQQQQHAFQPPSSVTRATSYDEPDALDQVSPKSIQTNHDVVTDAAELPRSTRETSAVSVERCDEVKSEEVSCSQQQLEGNLHSRASRAAKEQEPLYEGVPIHRNVQKRSETFESKENAPQPVNNDITETPTFPTELHQPTSMLRLQDRGRRRTTSTEYAGADVADAGLGLSTDAPVQPVDIGKTDNASEVEHEAHHQTRSAPLELTIQVSFRDFCVFVLCDAEHVRLDWLISGERVYSAWT